MKTSAVLLLPGFIVGLLVATYGFKLGASENIGILGWGLLITGSLALTWLIATVFNLAIFAPVYWLLGRSAAKKNLTEKTRQPDD